MRTRRKFLFDCSAMMAGIALVPAGYGRLSAKGRAASVFRGLDQMGYAVLAAQVNTTFRVRPAAGRVVELTLLKAPIAPPSPPRPGRRPAGDAGNEKFSLMFSGPKDPLIESGIHPFEHPRLGRFEMYIGQIGTEDRERVRYEAVFNRPPPGGAWSGINQA